ncbi:MAG: hypothetical protein IKI08_01630 [Selenomonadaceae bacterium]|nr:hypothetical protein [Selenomonadaceae bacterium]MBR7024697.1 hypothetical protein [Selenomonadaceae bacterium]
MLRDLIGKILNKTKKVVTLSAARTSSGEFLLKKTDYGLIRVEFAAVQRIAERALADIKEIHDTTVAVEKLNAVNPLKIRLTTTLAEGFSAPRASQAADKAINTALKEFLALEFYVPVEVKVKQIVKPVTQKRRVR